MTTATDNSHFNPVRTLQQILETDYPRPANLIENLATPGEIILFIARQKEGKSTFTLQLAIDVSCGDAFLGQYRTTKTRVLYVDYENRLYRVHERGKDLSNNRAVDNLLYKTYEILSERDVGLSGPDYQKLRKTVDAGKCGMLILDPLRYALGSAAPKGTSDESAAIKAIDSVSQLRQLNTELTTILVHHVKKRQDFSHNTIKLKDDPRSWIEQIYGSQALLGHVDNIWGLEQNEDGYTFATVSRSQEPLILTLGKEPESERFVLNKESSCRFKTEKQLQAWNKLPSEFSWSEAVAIIGSSNTVDRVIRQAKSRRLLTQDSISKRYKKVAPDGRE
jgi:hypothetical protein